MIESMLVAQQKWDEYIKQLASKVDVLITRNKMLEAQIAQQANFSSTPLDRLPSKTEPNCREHCNCIVLRSGKQLEGPKGATVEEDGEKKHDKSDNAFPSDGNPKRRAKVRSLRSLSSHPLSLTCLPCLSHKELLRPKLMPTWKVSWCA